MFDLIKWFDLFFETKPSVSSQSLELFADLENSEKLLKHYSFDCAKELELLEKDIATLGLAIDAERKEYEFALSNILFELPVYKRVNPIVREYRHKRNCAAAYELFLNLHQLKEVCTHETLMDELLLIKKSDFAQLFKTNGFQKMAFNGIDRSLSQETQARIQSFKNLPANRFTYRRLSSSFYKAPLVITDGLLENNPYIYDDKYSGMLMDELNVAVSNFGTFVFFTEFEAAENFTWVLIVAVDAITK